MKPVDIGNWAWSTEQGGRVIVESKGCRLEEYNHGGSHTPSLWILSSPEGGQEWRSHAATALRRFAHVVVTGDYNTLTVETRRVPEDIDHLWNAYRSTYLELDLAKAGL
jgi:hypothetical protein